MVVAVPRVGRKSSITVLTKFDERKREVKEKRDGDGEVKGGSEGVKEGDEKAGVSFWTSTKAREREEVN